MARTALVLLALLVTLPGCLTTPNTDDDDPGDDDDAVPDDDDDASDDDDAAPTETIPEGVTELWITQNIEGSKVERLVLIHAPAEVDELASYPVFFGFHGNGGGPGPFINQLGGYVDQGHFIGVYPQGFEQSWNLGQEVSPADDVAFVDAIVAVLAGYTQVDMDRLFALGTSNGAGMVHRLAMRTDHFVAIAAMSTALTTAEGPGPETAPVSVLQVHGIDDPVCPYEGGASVTGHEFLHAEASAQAWATANGCPPGTTSTTADGNILLEFGPCDDGTRVAHYGVVGAQHSIPSSTEGGLHALIWGFFTD